MAQLFTLIYCLFENLFGTELAGYLAGEATQRQQSNLFLSIGLLMLGITVVVAVIFYYVVNHPKLNNWWGWGIFMAANGLINYIVARRRVLGDLMDGMMEKMDNATGVLVPLGITESDCEAFGLSNLIVSCIAFLIVSLIIKWWSTNVPQAPF